MRPASGALAAAISCGILAGLGVLVGLTAHPHRVRAGEASGSTVQTSRLQSLTRMIEQNAPVAEDGAGPQTDADVGYAALRLEEERTRRYIVMGLIGACLLSLVLVLTFLCRNRSCTTSALVNGSGSSSSSTRPSWSS
jgi:hypothetical protein